MMEALPLTHWEGPLLSAQPPHHVLEPQSLAWTPSCGRVSLHPHGHPLVAPCPGSWQLITSVVGGEGPLAGQLQGPQRNLHVLTGP